MCYPKPGPRCPSGATLRLKRAKKAFEDSPKVSTELAYYEAVHDFYLTSVGIDLLKKKLESVESDEEREGLVQDIERYQTERDERIALSSLSFDRNAFIRTKLLAVSLNKDPDVPAGRYVDSIASLEEFEAEVAAGYVSVTKHPDPEIPYVVLDYTPSTTYEKRWNDVTMNSRGLIVNYETGEIVARPFPKFFNDNESNEYNEFSRTGPVVVSNKEDGSMGTLYFTPAGSPEISTRGSMRSDQAKHASELYQERYAGKWEPDEDKTYVFEVIYPENRIVLDYGDKDDLVLIGAIDKETGVTVPLNKLDWPGEKAQVLEFDSYEAALQTPVPADKEGYVVHFTNSDKRVKLKGAEYIKLHKIMTNMTKISVWEKVRDDGGMDVETLKVVPEEFRENIETYQNDLLQQFNAKVSSYEGKAKSVREKFGFKTLDDLAHEDRRAVAQYVSTEYKAETSAVLGLLASESMPERLRKNIWLSIRPKGKQVI